MARKIDLHPDDVQTLTGIRTQLRQARIDAGVSGYNLSRQLGRNKEFISGLERGVNDSPRMSTLQQWAGSVGLRIEFGVDKLWLFAHMSGEMSALYATSRPWGADAHARLWLVAALRQWRIKVGMDVSVLAPLLDLDADGVRRWEYESVDPLIARAMLQARLTGTSVTMRLFTQQEWIYG